MTEVVYARVPDTLKAALDEQAVLNATTLTSTVVDLLGRGLESVAERGIVEQLRSELTQLRKDLARAEADRDAAEAKSAALGAAARRARNTVGRCPVCDQPVSGETFLVGGACEHCGAGLSSLLTSSSPGLDKGELLLLLGALGAAVAVAAVMTKGR